MCRHMLTHILSLVQVQVWAVLSLGPVRIKCNVVCELERTVQLSLLFPQTLGLTLLQLSKSQSITVPAHIIEK